jgi:hypothetical protein
MAFFQPLRSSPLLGLTAFASLGALLLGGCGPDLSTPVHWSIQHGAVVCDAPTTQRVIPVVPSPQQVCSWACVNYADHRRQDVEVWFSTTDGGATWAFDRVLTSDSLSCGP